MEYSWIYVICWADGTVSLDSRPDQAETIEYDEDEDEFIFNNAPDVEPNKDLDAFDPNQTYIINKAFGLKTSLKPGEYIEIRVTEGLDE